MEQQLTDEEIISEKIDSHINSANLQYIIKTGKINGTMLEYIKQAMGIYAAQQSIGFAEWVEKEGWVFLIRGVWRNKSGHTEYTSSELFDIYLKSLNKTKP